MYVFSRPFLVGKMKHANKTTKKSKGQTRENYIYVFVVKWFFSPISAKSQPIATNLPLVEATNIGNAHISGASESLRTSAIITL